MLDEDKLTTRMGFMSIALIVGLYMMQTVQSQLIPTEVEPPFGSPWLLPVGLIINVEYGDEGEPLYIGEAQPGTPNDVPMWRIYRYDYEVIAGDREMVGLRYAEGNTLFNKKWSERTEYEYI